MDNILAGNADSGQRAAEERADQHVGGWHASWAGESPEEVVAAVPKTVAASTRGRDPGRNDVQHKVVVDAEEMQKRR